MLLFFSGFSFIQLAGCGFATRIKAAICFVAQSPAGVACVGPSSLSLPFEVSAEGFRTPAMEEILARVAVLEQKITTEHFKKVLAISCNVAIKRLEDFEGESKWRLQRLVDLASRRFNDTIAKNGFAYKTMREELSLVVSQLEKRLDAQSKELDKVDKGLKQLKNLEAGLMKIIRKDKEDSAARLEELEKSSKVLAKVTAGIDKGLAAKTKEILAKVSADIEAGLNAKASTILAKVSADMGAGLEAKSKEMFGEEHKGSNAKPVPVRGLPLTDLLSSSPRCPLGLGEMGVDCGIRGGRTDQGLTGRVRSQVLGRLSSASRASSVDPPLSQVDSLLCCFSGQSGPTIAEHGASVTAQGDASSCSLGGMLQAEAASDIRHTRQIAFGRDILRRSRDEPRGRASSVHEMIRAAQGDAYVRVVAARRSASLQPDVFRTSTGAQYLGCDRTRI